MEVEEPREPAQDFRALKEGDVTSMVDNIFAKAKQEATALSAPYLFAPSVHMLDMSFLLLVLFVFLLLLPIRLSSM